MRRHRCAKIIATLGPASSTSLMIESLFLAGVDAFRLNFSHGSHEDHRKRHLVIRELEKKTGRPIAIIMDLQGPKLRIGTFQQRSIFLNESQTFILDQQEASGDETRVFLPHPEIFAAIREGSQLLLDDGKISLQVVKLAEKHIETKVLTGGVLSDRKGLNVPSVALPISAMTTKDREDLSFGLNLGIDWVALSFVQRPDDILEARELIKDRAGIISKLEKPQAIQHLEEIVQLSDAIMVARGDLGVEMPPEEVPSIQKQIVRCCRKAGKPVVIATQMLDSMIKSPTPTRAEASDVATAIYDAVDAVMLSAESASGDYPLESVTIMDRIITHVERDPFYRKMQEASLPEPKATTSDAITAAARQVAHTLQAATIVTFTSTGATTLRAARERPEAPILALTPEIAIARKLAIVWGVHSVKSQEVKTFSEAVHNACLIAEKEGFAQLNDRIVVTAGVPFRVSGSTNILRIATLTARQQ
ncbi:MAG: pyruvate kinase [Alphaproteobacteria bacterium]|jgi:pyruvate kinase|nr:pyruvate kinase [Alphaproteobacteria bacterium]MBP7729602.1 pyruvate kinase [Alphaproteobacteria bacterium]